MRKNMHRHVESADGPRTSRNASADKLRPGMQPVKGPPKAMVRKGIETTRG